MKYLNEEEVKLLNEMKDRCLNGGQYKDENSKKKFNMLCHLEDFAVQYYNYKELYEKEKKNCKELIKFLEEEKNRLARECSSIYEDSLGKTRLVNEDIFNEVNVILSKYKEMQGSEIEYGRRNAISKYIG